MKEQIKQIIIFVSVIVIVAPLLNDYLLENLFFSGTSFHYTGFLFTFFEAMFLTFSVRVLLGIASIKFLFKLFFSKDVDEDSMEGPQKYSRLVIPAAILYGLAYGMVVRFMLDGYSLFGCMGKMMVFSLCWGLIYRYCWNKKYLYWFYEGLYDDDDAYADSGQEPKDQK
jgi:hypothetical protein